MMAITKEQALTAREFCLNDRCKRFTGPRGGVHVDMQIWRRNGKTKTWKRSPDRFEVPVKHGLYAYGYIDNTNAHAFHVYAEDGCAHKPEPKPEVTPEFVAYERMGESMAAEILGRRFPFND